MRQLPTTGLSACTGAGERIACQTENRLDGNACTSKSVCKTQTPWREFGRLHQKLNELKQAIVLGFNHSFVGKFAILGSKNPASLQINAVTYYESMTYNL